VKEVLCDIAPMDSCHLLLGWLWLRFETLNLDERSLYLRHGGHKIKLKFMAPRQVSRDQHRLKDKIEKEAIESEERKENEEKETKIRKNSTKNLFVNDFSSIVCDVILPKQRVGHMNEIHELLCMKKKLVHSALLCIQSTDEKQSLEDKLTLCMELLVVTYEDEGVLVRKVLHELQPLERNKTKFIRVAFDPRRREIVSSCGQIKFFTRT